MSIPKTPRGMVVLQLSLLHQNAPRARAVLGPLVGLMQRAAGEGRADAELQVATPDQTVEQQVNSRTEVFSFKAPRGVVRGGAGAVWNVCAATLGGPVVAFAVFMHRAMDGRGATGVAVGLVEAPVWGTAFAAIGYAAAAAQLARGSWNTVSAPYWRATGRRWHPVARRWSVPAPFLRDSFVDAMPDNEALYFAALKREKLRNSYKMPGQKSSDGKTNLYDVLGATEQSTEKELKEAYNRRAMALHPDRNPNPEAKQQFDEVVKAYKVLSDPGKRKLYDMGGDKALDQCAGCAPGTAAHLSSKRSGMQEIFGGAPTCALSGDFMKARWSRRLLDDVVYSPEETDLINERMMRKVAAEILSYYRPDPARADLVYVPRTTSEAQFKQWELAASKRVTAFFHLGLSKEVLNLVGSELVRSYDFGCASVASRMVSILGDDWRRLRHAGDRIVMIATDSATKRGNRHYLMDSAWRMAVPDIQENVRDASLQVLFDGGSKGEWGSSGAKEPSSSTPDGDATCVLPPPDAVAMRSAFLGDLGRVLAKHGKLYEGASEATMKKMQESVHESLRQKQRSQQQA